MDQWNNAILKTTHHFLDNLSQILFGKKMAIESINLFNKDYTKTFNIIWHHIQNLDIKDVENNYIFIKSILPIQDVEPIKTMDLFIKQGFVFFFLDFYKSWLVKKRWVSEMLNTNTINQPLDDYENYIVRNLESLIDLSQRFLNQRIDEKKIKLINPLFHDGKLFYDLIVQGGSFEVDDKLKDHIRAVLTEEEYNTLIDIIQSDKLINLVRVGKLKLAPDFKARIIALLSNDIPSTNELKFKIAALFQEATPAQLKDVEKVTDIVGQKTIDPKLFLGKMAESLQQAQVSPELLHEILDTDFGESFGLSSRELQAALIFELLKEKNITQPTINVIVDGKNQVQHKL